jgi:putative DNA primase/helicase
VKTPVEKVLEVVDRYEERHNGLWCICPAHDDHNPSLHVQEAEDGSALLVCRTGCEQEDVISALEERGLRRRDLFADDASGAVVPFSGHPKGLKGRRKDLGSLVKTYQLRDASGRLVAFHERWEDGETKSFLWKHPHGKYSRTGEIDAAAMPLYGAELVAAWPNGCGIVLVEGETPAEALRAANVRALGTVTGASGTPNAETLEILRDHKVILWPDGDPPGPGHMQRIGAKLTGVAAEVRVYEWADSPAGVKGPDAADHPAVQSRDLDSLRELRRALGAAPMLDPDEVNASESVNRTEPGTVDPQDRRGLTVTLAEAIQDRRHFAKDAGGKLYHYEDGVYRPGGDERIAVEVKHLLAENDISAKWSTHRAKEIAEYIRVDAPRLWTQPPRDRINLLNGILEVETEKLTPHTAEFLSAVQLPIVYDPEARCPGWNRFISETFPPDAQGLAYEIPAWLMTPDTSIQKAILLLGEGSNGKSTYLAALGAFVGRENYATLSLQKIEADRFSAARLVGKLANICPDLPSDHLSSTSTFKAITGGDPIPAEYKYGNPFDLRPFSRLVFSANHPPRSGDASYAFYRRWLVVPFDRSFEPGAQRPRDELDAELSDSRELSGLLNRALEALRGVRRRGGFSESASTRDALAEFRQTTDPLSVWLDRNTIEHPEAMVSQDELRSAFNQFAENSGKPGMTPQAFGRALLRAKPGIERGQRTWRGTSNTRVYLGIGLRLGPPERQRDQRDDPNCFVQENGHPEYTDYGVIENNRGQRVDRVERRGAEGSGTNSRTHPDAGARVSAASTATEHLDALRERFEEDAANEAGECN